MKRFLVVVVLVMLVRFFVLGCARQMIYDGKTYYNPELDCVSELKGNSDGWCDEQK